MCAWESYVLCVSGGSSQRDSVGGGAVQRPHRRKGVSHAVSAIGSPGSSRGRVRGTARSTQIQECPLSLARNLEPGSLRAAG